MSFYCRFLPFPFSKLLFFGWQVPDLPKINPQSHKIVQLVAGIWRLPAISRSLLCHQKDGLGQLKKLSNSTLLRFLCPWVFLLCWASALAQPKIEFQIKKPEQFQDRKLGSEKMADKKFTLVRHIFQNTYTRYNYFFNANEKIKGIVAYAKLAKKDDYTSLLSFKPYDLETTALSGDIDSILETTTAGILLHDLRNDWVDNLYLLMGKAYFLRGNFDSAYMTFQYLNYSFSPKEEGGYSQPIGTNSVEGSNAMTISTNEKSKKLKKMLLGPPSRNESFIWMVNSLLEGGQKWEAAALISTLQNDPKFPARLRTDLLESNAQFHYLNQQWDSAAFNLQAVARVGNSDAATRARQWYLTGQLFQLANKKTEAADAFSQCIKVNLDPVMDVYAHLNLIRLRKEEDPEIIDQSIAELASMAKKDRYIRYRDIIYYAAGLFEMERNGFDKAADFLHKSIAANDINTIQRSQSFLLLGDVLYSAKRYGLAFLPYDSVMLPHVKPSDSARVAWRKPIAQVLYQGNQTTYLYDSLLRIANMPETERQDFVKALSRRLRKEKGMKEDAESSTLLNTSANRNVQPNTLFPSNSKTWYFNDPGIRASGFSAFRQKWGDRPNADDWRRSSANDLFVNNPSNLDAKTVDSLAEDVEKFDTSDVSFDNLYSRLPITESRKNAAINKMAAAYLDKGKTLISKVEDYTLGIKTLDSIFLYSTTANEIPEAMYQMMYAYNKMGDLAGAEAVKRRLEQNFPNSAAALRATQSLDQPSTDNAITKQYKQAYDWYLQGNFTEALALKTKLDQEHKTTFWSPQLIYIETIHQLQTKQDSLATQNLNFLVANFPKHPLAEKAKIILEVLPKRSEIEDYLTKLEVTRAEEERLVVVSESKVNQPKKDLAPTKKTDPVLPSVTPSIKIDSSYRTLQPVAVKQPSPYLVNPTAATNIAIILPNIDPAYVNEVVYSLNSSPKRNSYKAQTTVEKKKIADQLWLVMLKSTSFTNVNEAYEYLQYLKPAAKNDMLSWLDSNTYRIIILSNEHLELIKNASDLTAYEQLLKETFPGKF